MATARTLSERLANICVELDRIDSVTDSQMGAPLLSKVRIQNASLVLMSTMKDSIQNYKAGKIAQPLDEFEKSLSDSLAKLKALDIEWNEAIKTVLASQVHLSPAVQSLKTASPELEALKSLMKSQDEKDTYLVAAKCYKTIVDRTKTAAAAYSQQATDKTQMAPIFAQIIKDSESILAAINATKSAAPSYNGALNLTLLGASLTSTNNPRLAPQSRSAIYTGPGPK